jgi:pyrroline-5-carboxylate reductase
MKDTTIGFIGGGNMAFSLVGGLLADGCAPGRIQVGEPDAARRQVLEERFGVRAFADNQAAADGAGALLFAVKPQALREVATDLAMQVQAQRPLVISIAAGIREPTLRRWLGEDIPVVRSMPNTPAMLQTGATALYAGPGVDEEQRDLAESILRAVGLTLWVPDETQLDSVTALSGSGPAYFFLLMEAMVQAGTRLGLTSDSARILTLQTALGAARMALESDVEPAILRQRVTSPGGTTERAIGVLEQAGLRDRVEEALRAARDRSVELSEQLGRD